MTAVRVSIGILAHNEEARIGATLRSVLAQDIFEIFPTEVVLVANGCSDGTVPLATKLLDKNPLPGSASARVEDLQAPGKANAWNRFVHDLSAPQASLLVLMDADITLARRDTISSMVSTLLDTKQAAVCVDQPVKDIELDPRRSFFQRALVASTPTIDPNDVPLCGQIYCVRSEEARRIRLPVEIMCEDGFLRALLLTHGFTAPENRRRIVLDCNASHTFGSVSTLREMFKHERWLVAGSIVNMLLFERFSAAASHGYSAMKLMEDWHRENPHWLPTYIESETKLRGWRLLPLPWWTRRWSRLRTLSFVKKIVRLPVAAAASFADAFIFFAAIRDVRGGRAYSYWGRAGRSEGNSGRN